jgi:hypothetical protein
MRPQSLSPRAFGGGALRVSEFIEGICQESVGFEIVGLGSLVEATTKSSADKVRWTWKSNEADYC